MPNVVNKAEDRDLWLNCRLRVKAVVLICSLYILLEQTIEKYEM
jgi:hypothetical protein